MKSKVWIFFGNWKFEFKNLGIENVELKIWEWKFWIEKLEFERYLKTLKMIFFFFWLTESTQFD